MDQEKSFETDAVNEEQQQEMDNKYDDVEQTKNGKKRTVLILIILAVLVLVSSIVGYSYFNNPSRQFCSLLEKEDYTAAEELVSTNILGINDEIEITFVDAILKYEVSTLEKLQLINETQWTDISTLQRISESLGLTGNSEKYITKLDGLQKHRERFAYLQILNNNREYFDNYMVLADSIPEYIEELEGLIDLLSGNTDPIVIINIKKAENAINELEDLFDVPYFLAEMEKQEAIAALMDVQGDMILGEIGLDSIIEDINILTELKVDLK